MEEVAGEVSTRDTRPSRRYSITGEPESRSKSQLAYHHLKERISDGSYTPGYRLVLSQIAQDLAISVVPVREAIRMLEAEGLVTFQRNVGAQVAMFDPTEYQITMQTLSLVEGYATALSAPALRQAQGTKGAQGTTDAPLERARRINEEMVQCLQHFDPANFTRLNREFHTVLFERCPNPHILDLVHRGWARLGVLRESTFSFVPGRAKESVAEHARLIELISDWADLLQIELAARNHRLATLNAFLAQQNAAQPNAAKQRNAAQEEGTSR